MWEPVTFEDRLLSRYMEENPGDLLLELPVGTTGATHGPRRIDGVLVPGKHTRARVVRDKDEAREAITGREVHLLEAKRSLNRNVIGQVEVGAALLQRDFRPSRVVPVAIYARRNADLEWYCGEKGLEVRYYPEVLERLEKTVPLLESEDERVDVRKPPSPGRQTAFLGGWTDAAQGRLYGSIRTKKTHANMGNLFGWIYGVQPDEFRIATWERYVDQLGDLPRQSSSEE